MARRWSTQKKIGAVAGLLLIALYAAYLGVAPFSVSVREGTFGAEWANAIVDVSSRCRAEINIIDGKTYLYQCDLSDKQYGNIAVKAGTQTFVGGGAGFSDPGSGGSVYYTEDFAKPGDKIDFWTGIRTKAAPNGVHIYSGVRWPEAPVAWTHDERSGGHVINLDPSVNSIRYEGNYQDDSGAHYFSYIAPNTNTHLYRLDGSRVTDGSRLYDESGTLVSWTSINDQACAPQPDAGGEIACVIFPDFIRVGKDVVFRLNGGIRVGDQPYRRQVRVWSATVDPAQALPTTSIPLSILGDFGFGINTPQLFTRNYFNSVPFCVVGDAFCSGDPVTTRTPVKVRSNLKWGDVADFAMDGEFESTSCFAGTWAGMVSCSWLFKGHIYFTEFDGEPVVAPSPTTTLPVATTPPPTSTPPPPTTEDSPEMMWYASLTPKEKLWADDAVKAGWVLDKVMMAYKEMGYAQKGIPGYTYSATVKTPNDGLHLEPVGTPAPASGTQSAPPATSPPVPAQKLGFWAWLWALLNRIAHR